MAAWHSATELLQDLQLFSQNAAALAPGPGPGITGHPQLLPPQHQQLLPPQHQQLLPLQQHDGGWLQLALAGALAGGGGGAGTDDDEATSPECSSLPQAVVPIATASI